MDALKQTDPEIYDIIAREERYQQDSVRQIPSENYASRPVMEETGSSVRAASRWKRGSSWAVASWSPRASGTTIIPVSTLSGTSSASRSQSRRARAKVRSTSSAALPFVEQYLDRYAGVGNSRRVGDR